MIPSGGGPQGAVVSAGGSEGAQPQAAESGASVMQGVSCNLTRHQQGLVTAEFDPMLQIHNRLPGLLEWQLESPAADGAAHISQYQWDHLYDPCHGMVSSYSALRRDAGFAGATVGCGFQLNASNGSPRLLMRQVGGAEA